MLQYLLYIVSPNQLELTKKSMERLRARRLENDDAGVAETWELQHRLLEGRVLRISLLTDADGVTSHMRQNPVDLLIYDERGGGIEAVDAIRRIRADMAELARLWGPDFQFPMSRIIAVLGEHTRGSSHRNFVLGRMNVRDVIEEPRSTAVLLRWIRDVLYHGVVRENRIGIAMSGGGIEGFLYQIGVIHALNRALPDRSLHEVDVVSGVSSGAIAGTVVAGQIPTQEVIRSVNGTSSIIPALTGRTLFDVATGHILKRMVRTSTTWKPMPGQWLSNTMRTIPTGFFKGESLEQYFRQVLESAGHPDDFNHLSAELYIGATDQDTFEHVTFGTEGRRDMPISEALRASCAFPMFFTPRHILGRRYIDGQVTKSCNLDIVVQRGCRLIFVIDPLKPTSTTVAGAAEKEGGVFGAVQTMKALCSTRFEQNLSHVSTQYPDVDFLVFQPDEKCARIMAGSPMRYRIRANLIELAYKSTLRKLRDRYSVYSVKLARYGFRLADPERLKELEKEYADVFDATG